MIPNHVGSPATFLSWRHALAMAPLFVAAALAAGCIAPETSDSVIPTEPERQTESMPPSPCSAGKTICECDTCGPAPVYTCFPSTRAGQQSCFNWCVACTP